MDRLPEQEIRLDGRFRIRCPLLDKYLRYNQGKLHHFNSYRER